MYEFQRGRPSFQQLKNKSGFSGHISMGRVGVENRVNPFISGTPFWGQFYLKLV